MPEYNVQQLTKVLTDFYTLTKIRIGLIDVTANERFSYPNARCPFCSMIRERPELDTKCRECDEAAFRRCKSNVTAEIYTCHAGLTEVIIPIVSSDIVLCYVMFGQILEESRSKETIESIRNTFLPYGFDPAQLDQVISKIDVRSMKEIAASATLLDAIASYFMSEKLISVGKMRFASLLNAYIDEHIGEPIYAASLCAYFEISRTRLYEMCQVNLKCSLAAYIQQRRVLYAKHLLETTELTSSEIAAASGFSDYNYFNRIFKKTTGYTARTYRKEFKPF